MCIRNADVTTTTTYQQCTCEVYVPICPLPPRKQNEISESMKVHRKHDVTRFWRKWGMARDGARNNMREGEEVGKQPAAFHQRHQERTRAWPIIVAAITHVTAHALTVWVWRECWFLRNICFTKPKPSSLPLPTPALPAIMTTRSLADKFMVILRSLPPVRSSDSYVSCEFLWPPPCGLAGSRGTLTHCEGWS